MAYIGNSPENIQRGRRFVYEFKATAGQTVFSGTDLNNQTLDLLEENEMGVYLNGVRLADSDDYTVSGDTLTLISAASLNDQLTVETQAEIANISSYTRAEADARYINYDGDIVAGDLQISGEVDAGSLIVDTDVLVVDATTDTVGVGTTNPGRKFEVSFAASSVAAKLTRNDVVGSALIEFANTSGVQSISGYDAGRGSYSILDGSSNPLVVVKNSSGYVGIGTESPVYQLHVNSGATNVVADFESTDGIAAIRLRDNNGNVELSANGNDFRVQPAGSTAEFVVKNGGNVGIGTDSPQEKLEVNGVLQIRRDGDHPALRFAEINSGTTTTRGYIASGDWAVNGGAIDDFGISGSVTGDLLFATNAGAERLRIQNSTGNVGIGTNSPAQKLHIYGATPQILLETSDSRGETWSIRSTNGAPSNTGTLSFRDEAGNNWFDLAQNEGAPITRFYSGASSERMVIKNDGKVGIGTTGPEVPLDVTNSRSTGYSNTQDQRGLAHIVARNGSDATGRFSSISWVSGGGTQAEGSINLVQTGNYVGDFTVKLRTGANSTDWRERVRIKANGNLGVNTDTGLAGHDLGNLLNVNNATVIGNDTSGSYFGYNLHYDGDWKYNKSSAAGLLSFTSTGELTYRSAPSGTAGNTSTLTTVFEIKANGEVVIDGGTGVGSAGTLHIRQKGDGDGDGIAITSSNGTSHRIWKDANGTLNMGPSNDTAAFNIDLGSRKIMRSNATWAGITNGSQSGSAFNAAGDWYSSRATNTNSLHVRWYNTNGLVGNISTNGSSTLYNTSSDHRLKENVVDLTGAITRLNQLEPKRFNFIADSDTIVDGFIAHEVQSIVPEAITGTYNEVDSDSNPVYQSIDQSKLVPLLTAAIKEQQTIIDDLKARIEALEG